MVEPALIEFIKAAEQPAVVAVSGFGGAGKSSFARALSSNINSPVISVDSFCTSLSKTDYKLWDVINFKRLETEVLKPFNSGRKTITYQEFDWEHNKTDSSTTIEAGGILIVEGVGLLRPQLMKYFSCKIWVDCPIEVAIERGKNRDIAWGLQQNEHWDSIWKENDLQYFREYSPRTNADFIIDLSSTGQPEAARR